MNKKALRAVMRLKRAAIPSVTRKKKDIRIARRLLASMLYKRAKTIGFYVSNNSEVETDFLLNKLGGKKIFVVPKTKQKHIHLYELKPDTTFEEAKFSIREPVNTSLFKKWKEIDLFIVPGIAFDKRGHRIGYGGGFFDRLLSKLNCTTIGLAYEQQIVDKIPEKKYDVAVSYILTERRLILCKHLPPSKNKIRKSTKSSSGK